MSANEGWREYVRQRMAKWDQPIVLKCGQWKCRDCAREWKKVGKRFAAPKCPDCGSRRPLWFALEWVQVADGTVMNTGAVEQMKGVLGVLGKGGAK